jgi:hypothetical protein
MACAFMRNRCGSTGFMSCRCPPEVRATAPAENLLEFQDRVTTLAYRTDLLHQDVQGLLTLSGPSDPRRETTQERIYRSVESVRDALRKLEGEFGRSER